MRRVAGAVARLAALAGMTAAFACASMAAPPGGPEDRVPPEVERVTPESGTVNFGRRAVEIRFDEVITDRGTGPGALEHLVLISPRDGTPRVSYRREAIAVRPRSGWRPNTTYTVTLLPGVADLRGNTSKETQALVFSTGPSIAPATLRGRVYDWLAERPAPRAWVEAIAPDSTIYVTVADSAGVFAVGPLPEGAYTLKAFIDQNNNRALDRAEAWDTVPTRTPPAGVATSIELLAAPRDTIPPRIANVALTDSVTISIEFDRPLDARQAISPALFSVVRADSTPVPIREALSRREFERRQETQRAAQDTTRADTARADTAAIRPVPPRPQLARGGTGPPRPSVPPPVQQVVLRLGAPLVPGASYRVTANGVRNLLGRPGTTSRVVQIPRPAAPSDTTRRAPPG